jgi:hypothetical protein
MTTTLDTMLVTTPDVCVVAPVSGSGKERLTP